MGNLLYKGSKVINKEDTPDINIVISSNYSRVLPYIGPCLSNNKYTDVNQLAKDIELSKRRAILCQEITVIQLLDKIYDRIKAKILSNNDDYEYTTTNEINNEIDDKIEYKMLYHNENRVPTFDYNNAIYEEDYAVLPYLVLDLWHHKYTSINKLKADIQLSKKRARLHLEKTIINDLNKIYNMIKLTI